MAFDQSRLYSAVSGDFGRPWDYNALSAVAPGTWTMMEAGTENGVGVPEPATLALSALGLAGLRWRRFTGALGGSLLFWFGGSFRTP